MSAFERIVPALLERARWIAAAAVERRPTAERWRDARWLWPSFTKD